MAPAALLALLAVLFLAHSGRSAPLSVGLIAKEFFFDPKDVSVGTGQIAFVVKNQGAIEHNFALEAPGGKTLAQIAIIEPGQTGKVTATLPAGIYTIYCSEPGHREAGMVATLRVGPQTLSFEALRRWEDTPEDGWLVLGVDVARFGDDETVIFPVRGKKALAPIVSLR